MTRRRRAAGMGKETRRMAYIVNGVERPTDADGYLVEPDFGDEVVPMIAQAEGIVLTDAHWEVIRYLRDEYQAHGHTPNFRNMLKGFQSVRPEADSKYLYDLFPLGPAKQGAKVAGLPQPYGKGGY
jgi:tRNA 2-thiouridine synthesizing protein E